VRKKLRKREGAYARLEGWGRATRFALMLRDASRRAWAVEAPALASGRDAPQHEGEGAPRVLAKRTQRRFGQTKPRIIWPSVVPAKAGTHDHRRWLWVPALAALGRDDDCLARAEHQPADVRNRDWGNFHCFGLILTMSFATPACLSADTHV